MTKTLVLITNNYPFLANGGEVMFVRPEIGPLKDRFDRIVIAPSNSTGPNVDPNNGCEIDLTLSQLLGQGPRGLLKNIPLAIKSKSRHLYFRELATSFFRYGPRALRRSLVWSLQAAVARYWATRSFNSGHEVIFYTYWNTGLTKGISEATKCTPNWSVVTRTHGYDLYHNAVAPPYIPFRPEVFYDLDRIYTIAKHGYDFLVQQGVPSQRLALARLGIADPGFRNRLSTDGKFRLVSCSFLVPVKRVALMASAICAFARGCQGVEIEWHHIGDGPDRELVEGILAVKPSNLKSSILGQMSNENVLHYYKNNASDLLINVSKSEGIPVTMMEACAIGLPILATAVGGVGEIVNSTNGVLLPEAITETDVANAIRYFHDLPLAKKMDLSNGARSVWSTHFDARQNHNAFADSLLELVGRKKLVAAGRAS